MVTPSATSAVNRPDLKNAVYREWDVTGMRRGFVADLACPEVVVQDASGVIKKIPSEQYLDEPDDRRAAGGGYSRSEFEYTQFTYDTQERGHEMRIDRNRAAQAGGYFNVEQEAADIVLYKEHALHEKRVADLLFSTTEFSGYTAAINGVAWDQHSTADPIGDLKIAIRAVKENTGITPNTVVLAWLAWDHLLECDAVLDRIGAESSADPKVANRSSVAKLLDVEEIIVADGYRMTTNKGQGTPTLGSIWSTDYALACYRAKGAVRPTTRTVAVNRHWMGDGSMYDFTTETYYNEEIRSNVLRARRQVEPVVMDASLGYLLSTVLTK